jgi:hypothetical protein
MQFSFAMWATISLLQQARLQHVVFPLKYEGGINMKWNIVIIVMLNIIHNQVLK